MRQVVDFEISLRSGVEDGALEAPFGVRCQDDETHLILQMVGIQKNHFRQTFLDQAFVQKNGNLAWLWGTYRGLPEHGLVQSGRESTATFSSAAEYNCTALSMAFFKTRMVEFRELGYAMLDFFAYLTNEDFASNVGPPSDQPEDL